MGTTAMIHSPARHGLTLLKHCTFPSSHAGWLDRHKLLRKNTAFQLNGDGGIHGKTEIALQMQVGMCATGLNVQTAG